MEEGRSSQAPTGESHDRFGEVAVREGLLTPSQINEALKTQNEKKGARIGEVLKKMGLITDDGIRQVLDKQVNERREGRRKRARVSLAPAPFSGQKTKDRHPTPPPIHPTPATEAALPAIGDFQLIRKLGQGAMGTVFLATQVSLDRPVALKVLPPDLAKASDFLERFRREARAAAKLNHPNIVMAYDVGIAAGYHYIAMEFVDGHDLEVEMESRPDKKIPPQEVFKIAREMALALEAAAQQGIVHRDVKPANILLDKEGVCKLTDLGLAMPKGGDNKLTTAGAAIGTPFYISPEQARGETNVDVRSDIYSLGATLFHLATGRLPFIDENPVVVMTKHLTETLPHPSDINPDIPKPLSRLIEKMMAKRKEDRHQNPKELLLDIQAAEHGEAPLLKRARAKARPISGPFGAPPPEEEEHLEVQLDKLPARNSAAPRKSLRPSGSVAPRSNKLPIAHTNPVLRSLRGLSTPARFAVIAVVFVVVAVIIGLVIGKIMQK